MRFSVPGSIPPHKSIDAPSEPVTGVRARDSGTTSERAQPTAALSGVAGLRFEPQRVVDFQSQHGALVSAVRGSLVLGALTLAGSLDRKEALAAALPGAHRDALFSALAASWVPIEALSAFFAACDQVFSDAQIAEIGKRMGSQITESLFAIMLRAARKSGVETPVWMGVTNGSRMWDRIYQGGGFSITKLGPKDMLFEVYGLPYAGSRWFRAIHMAFMQGMMSTVTKTCVVRVMRASRPDPDRFAVSLSWV